MIQHVNPHYAARGMRSRRMEDFTWMNDRGRQAADRYDFTVDHLVSHVEIQTVKVFSALVAYYRKKWKRILRQLYCRTQMKPFF